ncbi:MAG: alpha/beta hydrolase [Balneolaceae bacterium]|jgi:pimeloyl-[acyl-carrier protein] methyl ester esterase
MTDLRFIAFHGWGFNKQYWQPWSDYISEYGCFEAYDRGYFRNPKEVEILADSSKTVVITHSFGLHWIEESILSEADLLIVIGGFLYFHPYTAQYKRRSRLILQEMINEFEIKPEKVLHKFYENCYAPCEAPQNELGEIDHQLLLDDLRTLQNSERDIQALKSAGKICIIHGTNDRIVPNQKGRQLYTQLQNRAKYFEIKQAGHSVPFTHPKQCLEFVTPEIEELAEIKL